MITRPTGTPNYLVTEDCGGLPIGYIAKYPGGKEWIFWPSVYRKPISRQIVEEILTCLEELNG